MSQNLPANPALSRVDTIKIAKLSQRGPGKAASTWVQSHQGKRNLAGPNIRRFRHVKNIRQIDLLGKLAKGGIVMTQGAIAKIETQQRAIFDYEMVAFARALSVSVADLIS